MQHGQLLRIVHVGPKQAWGPPQMCTSWAYCTALRSCPFCVVLCDNSNVGEFTVTHLLHPMQMVPETVAGMSKMHMLGCCSSSQDAAPFLQLLSPWVVGISRCCCKDACYWQLQSSPGRQRSPSSGNASHGEQRCYYPSQSQVLRQIS